MEGVLFALFGESGVISKSGSLLGFWNVARASRLRGGSRAMSGGTPDLHERLQKSMSFETLVLLPEMEAWRFGRISFAR